MTVVVVPFLYVGTLISKNFAALLEEHDIFVPEDDDDDDWANLRRNGAYQPAQRETGKMGHFDLEGLFTSTCLRLVFSVI